MAEITEPTYEWVDNLPVQPDTDTQPVAQPDTQQNSPTVQPDHPSIFSEEVVQQLIAL